MSWKNIEEKLKHALPIKVSFPAGTIWLPQSHLTIDEWLGSIAETAEEFRELDIPRIRFLQNHWRIDKLVELEWDDQFANKRVIVAMIVGSRAYILLSDWSDYQVIAAVEPNDTPSLYRAVVGKLFENRRFIRVQPTHIRNHRPDLVPDFVAPSRKDREGRGSREERLVFEGEAAGVAPADSLVSGAIAEERWKSFLSDILVGWIGKWLNLPEVGFWHEEMPESITNAKDEKIVMQYESSHGEKERKQAS
jgi:hypothetical protein